MASIIAVRRSKRDNMLVALCLAGLVAGGLSAFFVTDYALTPRDLIISLYLGVFQVGGGLHTGSARFTLRTRSTSRVTRAG